MPFVRFVNAYYESDSFYVITYALSNKMRHLKQDPVAAVAGDWFTAHVKRTDLGWFCAEENRALAERMHQAFSSWIDSGHNDFSDRNTIILRLELVNAVLFSHGTRYEL